MVEKLARLLLRLWRQRQWDRRRRIMDRAYEVLGKRVLHAAVERAARLEAEGR